MSLLLLFDDNLSKGGITPPTPPLNGYVAENGTTYYVAENGTTYYVQEV